MKTTPIHAWPVAQDTDPVKQYPAAVDDPFKADLDRKVIGRFANVADRTAKVPSPTAGMLSYLIDQARYERYSGGAWLPEIRVWGSGAPLAGSAPATYDHAAVVQFGTSTVTPNANGKASIVFPHPFPTCLLSVVATLGNPDPRQIVLSDTDYLVGGCAVTFYTAAGALAPNGAAVRVNWIAAGF